MTDHEFEEQFANCTLPPAGFDHRGHLRIAWLHLQRFPLDEAISLTCTGIGRYAASLGAAGKFHWTVTEALMRLMHAGGAADPDLPFHRFLERQAALVADARGAVGRHYSDALLATDSARSGFVPPDLAPLPATSPEA